MERTLRRMVERLLSRMLLLHVNDLLMYGTRRAVVVEVRYWALLNMGAWMVVEMLRVLRWRLSH